MLNYVASSRKWYKGILNVKCLYERNIEINSQQSGSQMRTCGGGIKEIEFSWLLATVFGFQILVW
jgi:hypothetical protein